MYKYYANYPPLPIGAELFLKLKYFYLKDHYRFYFLPIFMKWWLNDAKEISFQGILVKTDLNT